MYKQLYSEFLKHNQNLMHFACHSHHYWPDAAKQGLLEYWEDSARLVDRKWEKILGEKVPRVQKLISQHLKFSRPEDITLAQNTHDFLIRLLSTFPKSKTLEILTTDSEFYSFERQIRRLEELGDVKVTRIPTQPFQTFEERFEKAIVQKTWDLIFLSHVFFNSGVAVRNLEALVDKASEKSLFVLDGYHSYMALPIDLSKIGDRIFFLAGGYKYAQSGEGCCFMTLPKNCELKPSITGWFAEMGHLQNFGNSIPYSTDGYRFAGSTMDYTALYRMHAVLELFEKEQITVARIHEHIVSQQRRFLKALPQLESLGLTSDKILKRDDHGPHGHFFTFELGSVEKCQQVYDSLLKRNILTDFRKSRLRFGFGLYHEGDYVL